MTVAKMQEQLERNLALVYPTEIFGSFFPGLEWERWERVGERSFSSLTFPPDTRSP